MSAKPEPTPIKDWEAEWFEREGVKDEEEKDAIRKRARIQRYANAKQRHDEEEEKKVTPGKKPWYKE